MIKRIAALLLCAIALASIFAGCTDDNNAAVVGKWTPVSATLNGETVQYSSLDIEDGKFMLEFDSGGGCAYTIGGIKTEGRYVFNETSVDIDDGTVQRKLSYDGENLTMDLDGTKFTFARLEEKK